MDNIVVAEKQKENNIFDKIKNSKRLKIIFIVIAIIICLSLTLTSFRDVETNQENVDVVNTYVNNLQAKLEKTLSKVKGVGKVSVVITIDSGMETVLASKITINETQSGKETIETPITVNGKTVVVKELFPKIKGVLIVAEGAENIFTMSKIQQATISLLDIDINQIEILSM
ncbi:MAG: hypothetical protein II988_04475 [Clostridia bacterium]|nr:hypothetical protein [Clostridia bacterium]